MSLLKKRRSARPIRKMDFAAEEATADGTVP
jgi:hypothetical protein